MPPDYERTWGICPVWDDSDGGYDVPRRAGLLRFTASCGQSVLRSSVMTNWYGNAVTCEPVGRMIRMSRFEWKDGVGIAFNAFPGSEFIRSSDWRHDDRRVQAEAIELARELHAEHLLIDERKGRKLAVQEGVPVVGLPRVLILAKREQFIPSARSLLQRLEREAGMYLSESIKDAALKMVNE